MPNPGSAASSRTAPAPSPKSTAVVRSSGSMIALMRSAPDHDHPPMHARGDELRAGGEGVEEARAGGRQVEAPDSPQAQPVLDEAGGGGEEHVRRHRRDDQGVYVLRPQSLRRHQPAHRFGAHGGRGLARRPDPALADPGAGDDPVVGGVERAGELGVGDDALGNVGRDSGDGGAARVFAGRCRACTKLYSRAMPPTIRRSTVTVRVGGVPVGSGHPIVVQSMTNTDTADVDRDGAPGGGAGARRQRAGAGHGEQRRGRRGGAPHRRGAGSLGVRGADHRRLPLQRPPAAHPPSRLRAGPRQVPDQSRATSAASAPTRTSAPSSRSRWRTTSRCGSASTGARSTRAC